MDKNATHTNTKSSGTWGQSYALVFDGPPQHSKGKSALARVFFIEILSLLIALPLAEPLVKSSARRAALPPSLFIRLQPTCPGGRSGERVLHGLGTSL